MRTRRLISALFVVALTATAAVQSPEQYFGFRIGSDKKLVRWDKIVEYMQAVANGTDRVILPAPGVFPLQMKREIARRRNGR